MKYQTEIITQIDASFAQQWKQLWKKAENANVYNSYEWFATCLETYKITDYELYVCYKDGTLVALLPLQKYRIYGIPVCGIFCKDKAVETGFLIEKYDRTLFKHFFDSIIKKKNLYFQKIDCKAAHLLHQLYPELFFSLMSVNPYISLTGDPFTNASATTISRIQKVIKKNPDTLRFESYRTDLEKHLLTMFMLQENSSKKVRSMDIFAQETTRNYYINLVKLCAKFIQINFLYFGKVPIAYELGFIYRDRYLGDQISYHNEYKKYVPGKVLVYYMANELKKQKINVLDQGGGISSYKLSFTNTYHILYTMYYSHNPVIMFYWKLINEVRRLRQVAYPKKYTRDHEFLFKRLQDVK